MTPSYHFFPACFSGIGVAALAAPFPSRRAALPPARLRSVVRLGLLLRDVRGQRQPVPPGLCGLQPGWISRRCRPHPGGGCLPGQALLWPQTRCDHVGSAPACPHRHIYLYRHIYIFIHMYMCIPMHMHIYIYIYASMEASLKLPPGQALQAP